MGGALLAWVLRGEGWQCLSGGASVCNGATRRWVGSLVRGWMNVRWVTDLVLSQVAEVIIVYFVGAATTAIYTPSQRLAHLCLDNASDLLHVSCGDQRSVSCACPPPSGLPYKRLDEICLDNASDFLHVSCGEHGSVPFASPPPLSDPCHSLAGDLLANPLATAPLFRCRYATMTCSSHPS